jgi:hypothetical protein
MTPPVFGLRPILAARLRFKVAEAVICTFDPSSFDGDDALVVEEARSSVASASTSWCASRGGGEFCLVHNDLLWGGWALENPQNTGLLWGIPRKPQDSGTFLTLRRTALQ